MDGIILSGVKVSKGVVIVARNAVKKDIPSYVMAVVSPAGIIK
jgi:acetyltransferase-like isoleucine patch superfamily enzyme